MSVSLAVYKGKGINSPDSIFINDIPVSFQRIWTGLWQESIINCDIHYFRSFSSYTVSQIPEVLEEIDRIYDYVQINGGKDKDYISARIRDQLKPFLTDFYNEHKDDVYWFDLG